MSYAKIVHAAYGLEIGRGEQKAAKESSKKQKMKGTFFGGCSIGGTEGYSSRCQASSGGATSSGPIPMSVCLKVPGGQCILARHVGIQAVKFPQAIMSFLW